MEDEFQKRSAPEWRKMIVDDKSITITGFIEAHRAGLLGEFPDEREETLNEIVNVVELLPHDFLDGDQVGILLEFFLGRLEMSALSGGAVIRGTRHLILKSKNLPSGFEEVVIRFMFKNGNVQSWARRERGLQYDILDWFLKNRLTLLQANGRDFVVTFIKSVSGERDPRCLVAVFSMFLQVARSFPLDPLAEDMFETVACYFPIEFKPQPEDTITKKYLSTLCISCLTASPSFSSYCFLLIDEKLNDEEYDEEQANDLLDLMIAACEKFPSQSISFHLTEMLAAIRSVGLNPRNRTKLPPNVQLALKSVISMCKNVPVSEGCKSKIVCDSLIENLEPFVLQAEMGLCDKAINLLIIGFSNLPDQYSKIVLEQTLSWVVTLVQGDSVNVAANKSEIIAESLNLMIHILHKAVSSGTSVYAGSLNQYRENIFDSFDVAREYCPKEALISIYKAAVIFIEADIVDPELIKRCKQKVLDGHQTIIVDDEFSNFCKLVTSLANHDLNIFKDIIERCPIDTWNPEKRVPILCSAASSEDSWNFVKSLVVAELEKGVDDRTLDYYKDMCVRCSSNNKLVMDQLQTFDNIIDKCTMNLENIGKCVQLICLQLDKSKHSEFMKTIFHRFNEANSDDIFNELNAKYGLGFLQNEEKELMVKILGKTLPFKVYLRFYFAAINREFVEFKGVNVDDLNDLWLSFTGVKAMLLGRTMSAMPYFCSLLEKISTLNCNLDEQFKYFLDFENAECNPEKCRYVTSGFLWRQKIFNLMVMEYKKTFEKLGKNGVGIIGLLPPLLEFAKTLGAVQVKNQFEMLMPLLIESLGADDTIDSSVLRAIPAFLSISEDLKSEDLALIVSRVCHVIRNQNSEMEQLVDSLESLKILAKRQQSRILYPFVSTVVLAVNKILGHPKRIVRQKSAVIKNSWEMLISK